MPGPYPLEFRREAVALLRSSGKTVPQLAGELGVSPQALGNWARQIDVDVLIRSQPRTLLWPFVPSQSLVASDTTIAGKKDRERAAPHQLGGVRLIPLV
jgi:transposase-like protein